MKKNMKKQTKKSRGNIVLLFILVVVISICTKSVFANGDKPTKQYTVESKDTLWTIAKNVSIESNSDNLNIQKIVYEIKKLNNMNSSDIFVGQELIIPIY